jgi:hypothetical protein
MVRVICEACYEDFLKDQMGPDPDENESSRG